MLEFFASFGAGISAAVLTLASFFIPIWLTFKVLPDPPGLSDPSRAHRAKQWALGITLVAIFGLIFFPSIDALKHRACKSAPDFEACMEGPDE